MDNSLYNALKSVGMHDYFQRLQQNGIDTLEKLAQLTPRDLVSLKINANDRNILRILCGEISKNIKAGLLLNPSKTKPNNNKNGLVENLLAPKPKIDFNDKIKVYIRKRPLNPREINRNEPDIIKVVSNQKLIVNEIKTKVDLTKYTQQHKYFFDHVFDSNCDSLDVYNKSTKALITHVLKGGNATCFAYGQTGSGKTYTMLNQENGLYVLAAKDLLNSSAKENYTVTISFYEIYQNTLFDLFNKKQKLQAWEDANQKVVINGLSEVLIDNLSELMLAFNTANAQRSTGSTKSNEYSSRSHAVLILNLKKQDNTIGKLTFIDLAGSERGAERGAADTQAKREGSEINKSLLALKECIRSMSQNKKHSAFRQSKLTQVLKDSFIGNSKTCMISTVAPTNSNCNHTLNTLRYTDRVKELKGESSPTTTTNELQPEQLEDETDVSPNNEMEIELEDLMEEEIPDIDNLISPNASDIGSKKAASTTTEISLANQSIGKASPRNNIIQTPLKEPSQKQIRSEQIYRSQKRNNKKYMLNSDEAIDFEPDEQLIESISRNHKRQIQTVTDLSKIETEYYIDLKNFRNNNSEKDEYDESFINYLKNVDSVLEQKVEVINEFREMVQRVLAKVSCNEE